jgi:drug/metabolite transporter (DMT)-like permease
LKANPRAYFALIFVCLVWGTTYMALRIGVEGFPPLIFAGIRQFTAAILLFLLVYFWRKKTWFSWEVFRSQMLPGFLLITVGNGLVSWAELYIPSGLASVICASMPVFVVLLNLAVPTSTRPNIWVWAGLILGLSGVFLLFRDSMEFTVTKYFLEGMIATILATISWAIGSIIVKNRKNAADPMWNAACQLFWGGVFLLLGSLIFEDWQNLPMITNASLIALVYLILFGSLGAYSAFTYALTKLPVGLVSIYAYVNPVVAVLLGFLFLNETVNSWTILALSLTITGIFLINLGYKRATASRLAKEKADKFIEAREYSLTEDV